MFTYYNNDALFEFEHIAKLSIITKPAMIIQCFFITGIKSRFISHICRSDIYALYLQNICPAELRGIISNKSILL